MYIDIASGFVIYAVFSFICGAEWSWLNLALTVSFSFFPFSPDFDLIPFFLGNELIFPLFGIKFRFSSHHFIHFPLPFLLIGTLAAFWWISFYLALLFFFGALAHFVHDSCEPPEKKSGIQWLFPFRRDLFYFHGGIQVLPYKNWKQHLDEKRRGAEKRSAWDEVKSRWEPIGVNTAIFLITSVLLLAVFFLLSR